MKAHGGFDACFLLDGGVSYTSEKARDAQRDAIRFEGAADCCIAQREDVLVGQHVVCPGHRADRLQAAVVVVSHAKACRQKQAIVVAVRHGWVEDEVGNRAFALRVHPTGAGAQAQRERIVQLEVLLDADFRSVETGVEIGAAELVSPIEREVLQRIRAVDRRAVDVITTTTRIEVFLLQADRATSRSCACSSHQHKSDKRMLHDFQLECKT